MPTTLDPIRTAAFRAWFETIDNDFDRAMTITKINRRTLERMRSGKQPPPVRLLDQLATDAADRGHADLAGYLAGAATPKVS